MYEEKPENISMREQMKGKRGGGGIMAGAVKSGDELDEQEAGDREGR